MNRLNLSKPTEELKQLIADNPDLPIVVLAGENASSDEFNLTYCSNIRFEIREILVDCELPFETDYVFDDRDYFEAVLTEYSIRLMETEYLSGEEIILFLDDKVREYLKKYEPYWKKVIAIIADNR